MAYTIEPWPTPLGVFAEDPFRGLLDGDGAVAPEATAPPMATSSLTVSDVHNLMACLCNAALPSAVHCSAAHQLRALATDPRYLSALAVPSFLAACVAKVERVVGGAEGDEGSEPLSIFQMQLPVACLELLGTLCTCSAGILVRPSPSYNEGV